MFFFHSLDRSDSPYHLDTLNTLYDMLEEGKIRSITGLNFPSNVLEEAKQNGFVLDSNQLTCNVIDQRYLNHNDCKYLYSNPLLSGILTEAYFYKNHEPSLFDLSFSQRKNLDNIRRWGKSIQVNQPTPSWSLFHKYILSTIYDISNQYDVSMSSVALRYIMQKSNKSLGSMVVGSKVGASEKWWRQNRCSQFREVFGFELEKATMEHLDEVSRLGSL